MPRIIPPGYAEARYVQRATGDPDPWICTLGVQVTDSPGDYTGVCETLAYAWNNQIRVNQSNLVTLEKIQLLVGQDGDEPLIVEYSVGTTGSGSGGYLPQNNALLIQKVTGLPGRRNKGRMYVPLILPEAQVDNVGVIDASTVTAFNTSLETFYDLLTDPTEGAVAAPPVILHSTTSGGNEVTPTPISSFQVSNVIATQRRRLR